MPAFLGPLCGFALGVALAWLAWASAARRDDSGWGSRTAVAALYGARAKQRAVLLNRSGDLHGAAEALARVVERIRSYAGKDPELNGIANGLLCDSQLFAARMAPMALKQQHFVSSAIAAMRTPTGQARRKGS